MTTRSELERTLSEMAGIESVSVVGVHSLIATVVSTCFRDQDEALRQEMVWKFLNDALGADELENVEFIFTSTPEENAAISAPSSVAS
jgi:acid stress-induced BolA-like protein IbaG/YrbA